MKQERVRLLRALARELDRGAQRKILERACRRMGELVQSGKMKKPDAVDLALEVALNHQLWTSEDERADLEREIGEWIEAGIPKAPPRTQQKNKFCWREHSMSAQELCDQRFIEVKFLVPGLVPEGVTLLVSRPKMGKSWLLLQIGSGVAAGMSTLAIGDDPPTCGDVLYLSLEDGERRIQRRMTKYFGASRNNWPERLTIASAWRRLDQGALDDLREWCRSVNRPTLIMIDTLKRVRPPKRGGQSDYDADYETFEGLIKLTHEFPGLAIIVAHHDRKMAADDVFDTVSGTKGLTGSVDTTAIIKRAAQGTTLHIQGRDLLDDVEKAVRFDRETCRWTILGEASEVQRSSERAGVLVVLRDAPAEGLSVGNIMTAVGVRSRDAADKLLQRMAKAGEIERRGRGKYSLPGAPMSEVSEYPKERQAFDELSVNPASEASDVPDRGPDAKGIDGSGRRARPAG